MPTGCPTTARSYSCRLPSWMLAGRIGPVTQAWQTAVGLQLAPCDRRLEGRPMRTRTEVASSPFFAKHMVHITC
jgi:hypothetical protein